MKALARTVWDKKTFKVCISGELKRSGVFFPNIICKREITDSGHNILGKGIDLLLLHNVDLIICIGARWLRLSILLRVTDISRRITVSLGKA